jgi:hypothetical protein
MAILTSGSDSLEEEDMAVEEEGFPTGDWFGAKGVRRWTVRCD